ncbi:hypothetical protein ABKN59_006720 [Abortiporus biennis]
MVAVIFVSLYEGSSFATNSILLIAKFLSWLRPLQTCEERTNTIIGSGGTFVASNPIFFSLRYLADERRSFKAYAVRCTSQYRRVTYYQLGPIHDVSLVFSLRVYGAIEDNFQLDAMIYQARWLPVGSLSYSFRKAYSIWFANLLP